MCPCFDSRQQTGQTPMPNMPMYPSPVISPGGYPTGMPSGPANFPSPIYTQPGMPGAPTMPGVPGVPAIPSIPSTGEGTMTTLSSTQFLPGFLRTQIGKRVRVDFLIGTNTMQDRSGLLLAVGASYILLREQETDDLLTCDLYSIKFVTIYQ
ncbi:MAG: hypothetical protein Q8920_13515 [Bacillota bacterium]|nr:hypothetical protein [Bacillota bacterium]